MSDLDDSQGNFSIEKKQNYASHAFKISSNYDSLINEYLVSGSISETKQLRYGENPHQKGFFKGSLESVFERIHGKELSYNNLLDIDSAYNLIKEFWEEECTFAILKHNNACGVAVRDNVLDAYNAALAGDPVSAFGGILITNSEINEKAALSIDKLFCEVILAPSYSEKALSILKSKKNRIILKLNNIILPKQNTRSCLNGFLIQDSDSITDSRDNLKCVTEKNPSEFEIEDLIFASKISKHTKSNTIVLARNKQLLASGTGQTSRVDALNQAIDKAKKFDFDLNKSVMASDAFFPFPDCIKIASESGIKSVIQPGGSIKDHLSIESCNENKISTGVNSFSDTNEL